MSPRSAPRRAGARPRRTGAGSEATARAVPERLQKMLARIGIGSRREAEDWIRAGRLTVNGRPATLGVRVGSQDKVQLDGRPVHARESRAAAPAFLCHRSPGE
ncbi:MAG TPA: S4 domain-containing protein, partial [Steroidobacteraceae bacterium]|nr:S4 domain-containing protein [Steroidobacteraceae bacterium]